MSPQITVSPQQDSTESAGTGPRPPVFSFDFHFKNLQLEFRFHKNFDVCVIHTQLRLLIALSFTGNGT